MPGPVLVLAAFLIAAGWSGTALAETRSLKLYYLHTGERAEITYKRDGKYVDSGLKKINHFLRDWRRNEPTKMDPHLLDLIWEVYRESGSRQYIHVISGYRSPATNSMLRKRGRGVAKYSQHMLGKAMDFFLPDVKLSKLREIGLKVGVGGVGYYPTSGSPFVHLDTGNVRHWPRMTRQELARIFPNGKTLHVPSDGKPLPGYEVALASYKARQANGGEIVVARADSGKKGGLFQKLFASTREDEQDDEEANTVPSPRTVKTSPAAKPEPAMAVAGNEEVRPSALAGVPIPSWAPRTGETSGEKEMAVASAPADKVAETPAEPPAMADAAVVDQGTGEEEIQLAGIPVPQRRPDYVPPTVIARSEPETPAVSPPTLVAALTAEEIENLRRTAVPSDRPEPAQAANDMAAGSDEPEQATPPRLTLASAGPSSPDLAQSPRLALFEEKRAAAADASAASVEQLERLSAIPEDRPDPAADTSPILVSSISPMPDPRPVARAAPRTLELALAASDDDASSASEAIRAMIEADARLRDRAERVADAAATTPPAEIVAEVPVPRRDPRPAAAGQEQPVEIAELEPAPVRQERRTTDTGDQAAWKVADARRLADTRSMERIDHIRAPAYGMSVMRGSPDTVLLAGFVARALPQPTHDFAGNSILVPDFVSFRTN